MADDKRSKIRESIEAEQDETLAEILRLREVLKSELEADLEDGDPHVYEREKILALLRNLEGKQYSLSRALNSIEDGTYGICEICGREISTERLEALSYTTHCVECKEHVEKGIVARPAGQLTL